MSLVASARSNRSRLQKGSLDLTFEKANLGRLTFAIHGFKIRASLKYSWHRLGAGGWSQEALWFLPAFQAVGRKGRNNGWLSLLAVLRTQREQSHCRKKLILSWSCWNHLFGPGKHVKLLPSLYGHRIILTPTKTITTFTVPSMYYGWSNIKKSLLPGVI